MKKWVDLNCHVSPYNEHVSNGQWTFHGVPRVIIIMVKTLMIEINPMNF
jgi:hypothetical protein